MSHAKLKFELMILITNLIIPAILESYSFADEIKIAQGIVFSDENNNGIFDKNEKSIPNVAVSNGIDVVVTDKNGKYKLPVKKREILFVIKPTGWMIKTDKLHISRSYYIYNPEGSSHLHYAGMPSTGQLPDSINFPLYKTNETKKFEAVILGDTQISNEKELEYFYHDAIEELTGIKAEFSVVLGDITFENLELFDGINQALALIGITSYSLPGNHDMNFDANEDDLALETYKRIYGPAYYAFNYGDVHFIALDNIIALKGDKPRLGYMEGLTDEQLQFVKNDLKFVGKDKLVVLMGHANFMEFKKNRQELLDVLANYPYTLSIAGHDHKIENVFLKSSEGWKGKEPHHIYIAGAVCGAWWQGFPGEENIPHSMMGDGSPNGYSVITFDKNKYSIRYKGFGKDKDYQMQAYLPDEVTSEDANKTEVILNVFAGSEKSIVEMKIDSDGKWQKMEQSPGKSQYYKIAVTEEEKYKSPRYDWCKEGDVSEHMWKANLTDKLGVGTHLIFFRTKDLFGQTYFAKRVFNIVE